MARVPDGFRPAWLRRLDAKPAEARQRAKWIEIDPDDLVVFEIEEGRRISPRPGQAH